MEKREYPNLLADLLQKQMDAKGIDLLRLSDRVGSTYEHVRKILRGLTFPSKYFLKIMCDVLNIDFDEANQLMQIDKVRRKFGFIPEELIKRKAS